MKENTIGMLGNQGYGLLAFLEMKIVFQIQCCIPHLPHKEVLREFSFKYPIYIHEIRSVVDCVTILVGC